jgi:hypothetical protein
MLPKLVPHTVATTPPDDTLQVKEEDKTVGASWTASTISDATALNATLKAS